MKTICHKLLALLITTGLFIGFAFFTGPSYGAPVDSESEDEVTLIKGDLETIKVFGLTRVSITHPEVADIINLDSEQILVLAKQAGQTILFLWDKYGKRSVVVRVFDEDLSAVKARIQQLLAEAGIKDVSLEVSKLEGKVIVSGEVSDEQKDTLSGLLESFGTNVLNLTKEKKVEDLVQIDAQITELNSSYSKNMGFEWTSALTYKETIPTFNPKAPTDFFKIGNFSRTTQIIADINALITEGKGKILSKPKLVCVSGKEASFLVGGEIPISTTTTSSGGTVQEDVEFREYGVTLHISPTIRNNNKIDINLSIEVSDIDATNAVGSRVAFTTRNAETQLFLENGQTVILAGLIKNSQSQTVKRIPLLGDIPILGAVFRSRKTTTPNTETELIISLTPTILSSAGSLAENDYSVSTTDAGSMAEENVETTQGVDSALYNEAIGTKTMVPQDIAPYIQLVQKRIAEKIIYPPKARQYGWEGTVKLALHILRDGTLAHASVKEPSGYELFDDNALDAAKSLAPYSSFPSELNLQELNITVPIVYSLENH